MILFPQGLIFNIIWKRVNKHINKRKLSAHQGDHSLKDRRMITNGYYI